MFPSLLFCSAFCAVMHVLKVAVRLVQRVCVCVCPEADKVLTEKQL
jgi:hypothetical protein